MALRDIFARFTVKVDAASVARANAKLDEGAAKAARMGAAYDNLGQKVRKGMGGAGRFNPDGTPFGDGVGPGLSGRNPPSTNWLDQFTNKIDDAQRSGEGFLGFLARARRACGLFGFASVIASGILAGFAVRMANMAGELTDVADKLGITIEQTQVWQAAMEQAGGTAEQMNKAFLALSKNAEAFGREKTITQMFQQLGVNPQDGENLKDLNTLMSETVLALADMDDTTKRAALAQNLLGKSGQALIPIMAKGRKETERFLKRMEEMGVVVSTKDAQAMDELGDKVALLSRAFQRFFLRVLSDPSGTFNSFIDSVSTAVGWINRMTEKSRIFTSMWIGAGAAGLSVVTHLGKQFGLWRGSLGAIGFLLRRIFLPLLAFDDILVFIEGGHSMLGKFIDKIFGLGTAFRVARKIRDGFRDITNAIGEAVAVLSSDFQGPPTAFQQKVLDVKNAFIELQDKFVSLFLNKEGKISFDSLANGFETAFVSVVFRLGEAFGRGIRSGITAVFDFLTNPPGPSTGFTPVDPNTGKPGKTVVSDDGKSALDKFNETIVRALNVPENIFHKMVNQLPANVRDPIRNFDAMLAKTIYARTNFPAITTPGGGLVQNVNVTVNAQGSSPRDTAAAVRNGVSQGMSEAMPRSPQAVAAGASL